jgi:disulfide bond formation protein DsbB
LIQNTLILTFVVALALYGTFLGVEIAWADSVIEIIPMRLSPSTISFALAVVASLIAATVRLIPIFSPQLLPATAIDTGP